MKLAIDHPEARRSRAIAPRRHLAAWLAASLLFLVHATAWGQCPGAWPDDASMALPVSPVGAPEPAGDPSVASDGAGGSYIAYVVQVPGGPDYVNVAHLDATGAALWTVSPGPSGVGTDVCSPAGGNPAVCEDGAGGCFVAWQESPVCGVVNIWTSHITAGGVATPAALAGDPPGADPPGSFAELRIAYDGSGGAWLASFCSDPAVPPDGAGIFVNHVDAAGVPFYGPAALLAGPVTGYSPPALAAFTDPVAGPACVVAYAGAVFPPGEIGVTKVALPGVVWSIPNVNGAGVMGMDPAIAHDGSGGALVAWGTTAAVGAGDIHFVHISSDGVVPPVFPGATREICGDPLTQSAPQVISDGSGGAIVTWTDERNAGIYAQRVDDELVFGDPSLVYWAADGIPITQLPFMEGPHTLVADGEGGAVIVWSDPRGAGLDLYAQRLSADGALLWAGAGGVPIATRPGTQFGQAVALVASDAELLDPTIGDPKIAFVVAFTDAAGLGAPSSVMAQRLDYFGALGCAAPMLTAVGDVPGDQGGKVELTWTASYRDNLPMDDIEFYSIWRRLPGDAMIASGTSPVCLGSLTLEKSRRLATQSAERVVMRPEAGTPPGLWELVGMQAAHRNGVGYSYAASTRMDASSVVGPAEASHSFFVSAHSRRPRIWWDSGVVMGFSLDNLAPIPPEGFTVTEIPEPEARALEIEADAVRPRMVLTWSRNTEPDFGAYAIYRGVTPDFVPANPNDFIARVTTLRYDDRDLVPGEAVFYRLAAIDRNGNASPYTPAQGGQVRTGVAAGAVLAHALEQNQPNPLRRVTEIRWSQPARARVSIEVFDTMGRRLRNLAQGEFPAGRHAVSWDARDAEGHAVGAGLYFYRIESGSFRQTRRMTVID